MSNDILPIPEFVDKALENILEQPSKSVGCTLSDMWYLVIGSRIGLLADKRRIKYAADMEAYKIEIEEAVSKIPQDKQINPDLQKIAAFLDASQYCIDKSELRKMFVKLISATMNKDTDQYVHISFGEILKQLVPDEIKILWKLPEKSLFQPLIDITVEKPEVKGQFTLYSNIGVLGYESACQYPEDLPLYVNNLIRLGVATVPDGQYLIDKWRYEKILTDSFVMDNLRKAENVGKPYINYKMIGISDLGDAIRKICV